MTAKWIPLDQDLPDIGRVVALMDEDRYVAEVGRDNHRIMAVGCLKRELSSDRTYWSVTGERRSKQGHQYVDPQSYLTHVLNQLSLLIKTG